MENSKVSYDILVLGYIWMPPNVMASTNYTTNDDAEYGGLDETDTEEWINKNTGDFSRVIDYRITKTMTKGDYWNTAIERIIIKEWSKEDSDDLYQNTIESRYEE